jgi:hypothetical protein
MAFRSRDLTDLTPASQSPPKWGVYGGMNDHVVPSWARVEATSLEKGRAGVTREEGS